MKNDLARDKAMEKLVATRLRAGLKPSGAACPDAAILAAYVERTLVPRERQNCEAHLAACMGCQALVAELVRLGEDDEPVSARSATLAPRRAATAPRFRWAWAGSALAAVLVVGIWYSGELRKPLQQPSGIQSLSQNRVANEPPAPQSTSLNEKQVATAPVNQQDKSKAVRLETKTLDVESDRKAAVKNRFVREARSNSVNALAGTPAKDESAQLNRAAAATPPEGTSAAHAQVSVPRPAPMAIPSERARLAMSESRDAAGAGKGGEAAAAAGTAGGVGGAIQSALESKTERAPAPPPPPPQHQPQAYQAAKKAANGPAGSSEPALQKAKTKQEADSIAQAHAVLRDQAKTDKEEAQTVEVTAAAQAVEVQAESVVPTWRVGRHGLIQQFEANGQWKKRNSGVKTDLNEISFSSTSVGWIVGQAGTILRSTDGGITWKAVSSPTIEDLIHVTAFSDQSASVVSRNGGTFATTDGGKTWASARP